MRLVFFGSPPFAAEILDHLLQQGYNIAAVVTQPPKPKGRSKQSVPTAVAELAEKHSLPLFQPKRPSEVADDLKSFNADLFVVAAYGALLKEDLLQMPPLGCINVHTSLLPKYRGAAPIQRALMEGETKTGVTIMHMVRELDAGDMIRQEEIPIPADMTYGELEMELCNVGKQLLVQVIEALKSGTASRTSQDPAGVTLAPKIEPAECEIEWHLPALQLHNLIRGVSPKPGAWCTVKVRGEPKRLKILRSEVSTEGDLVVPCGEGSLCLLEVQMEGKKQMKIKDFLAGYSPADLKF